MKKTQKRMIREMSQVLTEDVIRMIEDLEKIQKANMKAERKARAKKRAKAAKARRKEYAFSWDDDRLTTDAYEEEMGAQPISYWEARERERLQDEMSY